MLEGLVISNVHIIAPPKPGSYVRVPGDKQYMLDNQSGHVLEAAAGKKHE